MTLRSNACVPNTIALLDAVAHAVSVGLTDRRASSISRRAEEEHLTSQARQSEETALRVAAVIGALPQKVREKVSASITRDSMVTVPLMELTSFEYPGPFLRMPFECPEAELDPAKLAYGGLGVWHYLTDAGLKPRLKYIMDDNIRRYKLAIVIDVPCI